MKVHPRRLRQDHFAFLESWQELYINWVRRYLSEPAGKMYEVEASMNTIYIEKYPSMKPSFIHRPPEQSNEIPEFSNKNTQVEGEAHIKQNDMLISD